VDESPTAIVCSALPSFLSTFFSLQNFC
jgi:hypothetical protein